MNVIDFYSDLKCVEDFLEISNLEKYADVPDDWEIIITDVVGSTKAIEAGRYKDVNTVGALIISGILNALAEIEVPFIFGGDGATLLIPSLFRERVVDVLDYTQSISDKIYNLKLRAGIVPVKIIRDHGHQIKILKLKISSSYQQAILAGTGIDYAETLIKNPETSELYNIEMKEMPKPADYTGFTCRWQDIPSKYGETLSLIVKSRSQDLTEQVKCYREVIGEIRNLFGDSSKHHPLHMDGLNLSLEYNRLILESKAFSHNFFQRIGKILNIYLENLVGILATILNRPIGNFAINTARNNMIISSDYKKFDGSLKMVFSGMPDQRKKLQAYLQKRYQDKNLFYGLHVSDRAMLTCLVFQGQGREVHFVDGADGGYALAAKELKSQIKSSLA